MIQSESLKVKAFPGPGLRKKCDLEAGQRDTALLALSVDQGEHEQRNESVEAGKGKDRERGPAGTFYDFSLLRLVYICVVLNHQVGNKLLC